MAAPIVKVRCYCCEQAVHEQDACIFVTSRRCGVGLRDVWICDDCLDHHLCLCEYCGEDHDEYWDCQYGYDIRDSDLWGCSGNRYGG